LLGDDAERDTGLNKLAGIGVTKAVENGFWRQCRLLDERTE
jgi:hypothetical protein